MSDATAPHHAITGSRSRRPRECSDETVEACGTVSEALEYVERARGHLYAFHQLMGHADMLFGDGADQLDRAGHPQQALTLRRQILGRNVIEGRWTFQIVEEFDADYHRRAIAAEAALRGDLMLGRRHVHESELKAQRQSAAWFSGED